MPPAITGTIETRPSRALPPPVIPISSFGPAPIPTTKLARDEELERLAVKEGILRVLKPCKEIEAIQGPLPDYEENNEESRIPQIVKELAPRYRLFVC